MPTNFQNFYKEIYVLSKHKYVHQGLSEKTEPQMFNKNIRILFTFQTIKNIYLKNL